MRFRSITFKLLAIIVTAFTFTTVGVVVLADHQLKQILDRSQEAVYAERVDTIVGFLDRSNERLQKTGLVAAYIDDFKRSALVFLRKNYYQRSDQSIYPFILDGDGKVVMHPLLPQGDTTFTDTPIAAIMHAAEKGTFDDQHQDWYTFRRFDGWNWVVGYRVPLDIKYSDARVFRNALVGIMGMVTVIVLLVLAFVVTRFARPIVELTEASKQLASGNLKRQIDLSGRDEIGILARSFDNMRVAIRDQIAELNREIGDRKRAVDELQNAKSLISNIINSMPSALVGVDVEGRITQWNKTVEQATGIVAEAARGNALSEMLPWMKTEMHRISESIGTRQIKQDRKRLRILEDEIRYEDVTIYPLITNGVEGAVIRIDDVTDKVRMEEMMIQSEKMLSVGGLAAGMAHEINNPLAGMIQNADVMGNRLTKPDIPANRRAAADAGTTMAAIGAFMAARGILHMLENIRQSGQRAAEIVANMLSFARKSEATFATHDLADLIDQTVALAGSDYDLKKKFDFRQIEILRKYAQDTPAVPCEAAKIQQVLLNLLRNGAEAMQAKWQAGKVDGSTNPPRFILRLAHEPASGMVRIEVEDNGPGIDAATMKRVFEPFFTTKPTDQGTGLGLSVSYFIITENHGGEMRVASVLGKGTTFIVRLPVKGDPKR